MNPKYNFLRGVLVPIITPFNEDNSIDFKSLEKQVLFLINNDIKGIVVCGTTGEGHLLTISEKKELIEFSTSVRNKVTEKFLIIVGTATKNLEEAIDISKFAEEKKCDALLVLCPNPKETNIIEYFKILGEETKLPIITYNIPKLNSQITPEDLSELINNNSVIGVKDSSQDYNLLPKWKNANPNTFVAVGEDTFITNGIKEGFADAAIPGTGNVAPKECIAAYKSGLAKDTLNAQEDLNQIIKKLVTTGSFVGALKQIQKENGIIKYKNKRV